MIELSLEGFRKYLEDVESRILDEIGTNRNGLVKTMN